MKKSLSIVLALGMALFMVFALLPGAAGADDTPPLVDGWYVISTEAQLRTFAAAPGSYASVRLGENIALTGTWVPIGSFSGTFDGGGHTISGIAIDTGSPGDAVGFFTKTNDASIKDLTLSGSITAQTASQRNIAVGGLTGRAVNTTIDNVHSDLTITVAHDGGNYNDHIYVGGLVGRACEDYVGGNVIRNCSFTGSISASRSGSLGPFRVGGLAGMFAGSEMQNSFFNGSITVAKDHHNGDAVGGLVGDFDDMEDRDAYPDYIVGVMDNCYAAGSITAGVNANVVGALCGVYCDDEDDYYGSPVASVSNTWYSSDMGRGYFGSGSTANTPGSFAPATESGSLCTSLNGVAGSISGYLSWGIVSGENGGLPVFMPEHTVTLITSAGITGFETSGNGTDYTAYTAPINVNHGGNLYVKATLDTGYTFEQWDTGITANPYQITNITAVVSYTPTSTLNTYTVTLTDNDTGITGFETSGNGTDYTAYTAPVSVAYGGDLWIKALLADDYTFGQWAGNATGNPYKIIGITGNQSYTPTAVPTVIPIATPSTYIVTLHLDGGTIASGKNVTGYTFGVGATLPAADDITKDGYTFGGWYDNDSFTGDPVTVISAADSGDKAFYARWTAIPSRSSRSARPLPAPAPVNNTIVIVDGQDHMIGTESRSGDNTTATVDQAALVEKIADADAGSDVIVPVSANSTVTAQLVVKNVEDMAAKAMTLTVQSGDISYSIPAGAVDTAGVIAELEIDDPALAPLAISINTALGDAALAAVNHAAALFGGEVVFPPLQFTITASYGGRTAEITGFERFVSRTVEITAEQAARITTAVVIEPDGSARHVPTEVFSANGKYYARINSLTNSTYALVWNEESFADAAGKWYEDIVNEMAGRRIVNGRTSEVFDGEGAITRAEFAAIIVRALGMPADGRASFTDVSAADWYAGAVGTAYEYGIIQGRGEGVFDPLARVTRQEAMAMIARAARVADFAGVSGDLSSFTDAGEISAWALDIARWNTGSGLIIGADGLIRPGDSISRAEAATVTLRLLQKAQLVDVRSRV